VRLVLGADGTVADARIGLNGAANRTLRATAAEDVLRGEAPSADLLRAAGDAAAAQSEPLADVDGDEAYKRTVIGVYTRRALEKALA
jgi:aerobic carbon-monoxide dehydrogenase medium subunit